MRGFHKQIKQERSDNPGMEAQFQYTKKRKRLSSKTMDVDKKQDQQIARLKKQIPKPEMKYFSSQFTGSLVASATFAAAELSTSATSLFIPILGTDLSNRIGRKVKLVKIRVTGCIKSTTQNLAGVNPHDVMSGRVLLVQNKECAMTALSTQDVMQAQPAAALAPYAFQSTASLGRYVILKDELFKLENPNTWFDQTTAKDEVNAIGHLIKWTHKFKTPVPVNFTAASTGVVGEIINNSFHVIGVAGNLDFNPIFEFNTRCYFMDV